MTGDPRVATVTPVTVMHPSDRTYRNQSVRLSDLTVISNVIERVTFENCTIDGPAVVVFQDSTLSGSSFEGDLDSTLWVIPASRQRVVGVIVMDHCNIVGCRLLRIGMCVPEAEVNDYRAALGGG